ncbi:Hypothetical protein PHPALM_20673 [Phytophthora palmivora]|uniref:Uncharacterized protein n=1 Tax=Phytophthora palmivora TaxID=4796 RepID=A0A2P4XE93_9STRA|nr:Hypothetical protein PHPALM_20673 [Phytophthora palmivora]
MNLRGERFEFEHICWYPKDGELCLSRVKPGESLNVQLYAVQKQVEESKKIADDQLVPVKGALVVAQQQLVKANEFRREHPEMAAAGLAVVVGVPSLLIRGKWSAVRNSVLAVGAGAAACYGSDKWAEKKRK